MPPQDAYLESQVLTAEPVELVCLLYRAARDATRSAGTHLAAGRIAERSRQICKAHASLAELSMGLDHERGGDLSRRLAELYDYMQRRLLEANQHQSSEPLREVESLLATLLSGWEEVRLARGQQAGPPAHHAWDGAGRAESGGYATGSFFVPDAPPEYASQSWSF